MIYNYIAYNKIFINLLYVYATLEQKLCLFNNKKDYVASDILFVLDEKLKSIYSDLPFLEAKIIINNPNLFTAGNLDKYFLNNY